MRKRTLKEFIEQATKMHNGKYDYSKVDYVNNHTKVCIICPEHGEFWQTPAKHLARRGCMKCAKNYIPTTEEFINKAKEVHGNKYDYSKAKYKNNHTKVCVICPEHGEFWVTPQCHIQKKSICPKCQKLHRPTLAEFIERAEQVHGDKYDYSKIIYKNARTKICVICPEHGEFWVTPDNFLNKKCGCKKCRQSSIENEVEKILKKNNIKYISQYSPSWLQNKYPMRFDFYLPDYHMAIECQGKQHFEEIEWFGGKKYLQDTILRDSLKRELCKEFKIILLYYANYKYNFPYQVITDKEQLLNEIKKYGKNITKIQNK